MWPCYGVCSIPCLCTLSASAFIDSSLYQLDFFLEIFLWRLDRLHNPAAHNAHRVKTSPMVIIANSKSCNFIRCMHAINAYFMFIGIIKWNKPYSIVMGWVKVHLQFTIIILCATNLCLRDSRTK